MSHEGHDVIWTGDLPSDSGNQQILAQANAEERILVTLDKDFDELAIVKGQSHCGIIRLVEISARNQSRICAILLARYANELLAGAIITADDHRVRIRHSTQLPPSSPPT